MLDEKHSRVFAWMHHRLIHTVCTYLCMVLPVMHCQMKPMGCSAITPLRMTRRRSINLMFICALFLFRALVGIARKTHLWNSLWKLDESGHIFSWISYLNLCLASHEKTGWIMGDSIDSKASFVNNKLSLSLRRRDEEDRKSVYYLQPLSSNANVIVV